MRSKIKKRQPARTLTIGVGASLDDLAADFLSVAKAVERGEKPEPREHLDFADMDTLLRTLTREIAQTHYAEHSERPFFASLVDFITSGPLVALVAEGPRAVEAFRALAGATDPVKAAPGTIRGDFALEVQNNIVHGSDSDESAKREIELFFPALA